MGAPRIRLTAEMKECAEKYVARVKRQGGSATDVFDEARELARQNLLTADGRRKKQSRPHVTAADKAALRQRAPFHGITLDADADGYFVKAKGDRTKSYPTVAAIPVRTIRDLAE